ncbi:PQQ-binding-like beta-propeller repeat protein [uncultured Rubinisphaera sp.]|uniref:outer membrane protein assembly factor BamB family protein n=1 Tax=uncultured Rubinisphaera sp. TaxID=1678686 RepID=UPI0030DA22A8
MPSGYIVGYAGYENPNVAPSELEVSLVPPPVPQSGTTYQCVVKTSTGITLATVTATTAITYCSPIPVTSLVGTGLSIELSYSGSSSGSLPSITISYPAGNATQMGGSGLCIQWENIETSSAATAQDDATPNTYWASFDIISNEPLFYYLSQYDWISIPTTSALLPQQIYDNDSGIANFSTLFRLDSWGYTTQLQTIALPIPESMNVIQCAFAIKNVISDRRPELSQWLTVTFQFDVGGPVTHSLSGGLPVNGQPWSPQSFLANVPNGAQTCTITLAANPIPVSGEQAVPAGPIVAMDDLTISFQQQPTPLGAGVIAYGDDQRNVYLVDATDGRVTHQKSMMYGSLVAPPASAQGLLFYGESNPSGASLLHAINPNTGNDYWAAGTVSLAGSVDCTPAIAGNTLYIGVSTGYLYGFDISDVQSPQQSMSYNVMNLSSGTQKVVSATLLSVDQSEVYLVSDAGIYGVSIAGGTPTLLWKVMTASAFGSCSGQLQGNILTVSSGTAVYAFDVTSTPDADGELLILWEFAPGGNLSAPNAGLSSVVLVGDSQGILHILDIYTGNSVSQVDTGQSSGLIATSATYGNRAVFTANTSGQVFAYQIQANDGSWTDSQLWNPASLSQGSTLPPLIANQVIYIAGADGKIHAFNFSDGTSLWTQTPTGSPSSSPVLSYRPTAVFPQASTTYDQCCWLCSHNAFSASSSGWWFSQQNEGIVWQLEVNGVRALMLDLYLREVNGTSQVVYDHEGAGKFLHWRLNWELFSRSLREIKDWLDANPNEVVTLLLEERVRPSAPGSNLNQKYANTKQLLESAFQDAGLMTTTPGAGYVFWSDRENAAQNGQLAWNVASDGWPTLQWMVESGHRLPVFSDRCYYPDPTITPSNQLPSATNLDDGFSWIYGYAVENHYDHRSVLDPYNASRRKESFELSNTSKKLFVLNYFENISSYFFPPSTTFTNNYFSLMTKIRGVYSSSGNAQRLPNFIALNFVDQPEILGPLSAVAQVNQLFQTHSAP